MNDQRDAILAVFNNYLGFFWVCVPLFYQGYIMAITALFDKDPRSITLRSLLSEVHKNPRPTGKSLIEIEQDIAAAEVVARKLYTIRNKLLAHKSVEVFGRDFYKEASLTYDEVRYLWDQCWAIFADLSIHVDGSIEDTLQDNLAQMDNVITALKGRGEPNPLMHIGSED